MANVTVDVHARLATQSLRRAETELFARVQRMGRDAGDGFSQNFATGVERGSRRADEALGGVAASTDRVRAAQERLNAAYRSGDIERIIRDTNRLTKAHRDAVTQSDRLATAQRNLHSAAAGSPLPMVAAGMASVARIGPGAIAVVGTAAAGLVQLAGIAASAAQSLWLVPSALGAIGAGVGTAALGFKGFGESLEKLRDPEAFIEALKKLTPAAQDAALHLRGILPAYDELQRKTQEAVFAGIGPQINQLANEFMPVITRLTTGVGGALNQMFSGVAQQLMRPETQGAIHEFINNVVTAFQNLAPAMAPLTQAFAQITAAGSSTLPALAQAAAEAATAFAEFIDNASRSGDLQRWLDEGLTTLSQLGSIIWDVGRMFVALKPAGEDILPSIVSSFDAMADTLPYIVDFIGDIGPIVEQITAPVRVLQGDFTAINDIVKGVGNTATWVFNRVRDVLNAMLQPIREAIDLANKLPGVNLPQISDISAPASAAPAMSRGALDRIHGTDYQSQILTGVNPTAGLPSAHPGYPSLPGDWWNGAIGSPLSGFDPAEQYRRQQQLYGGSAASKTPEGLVPNADQLKQTIERLFPGVRVNADVGRKDAYGEHSSGEALDIMVGNNRALGEQINRWLLLNADAFGLQYNLWHQAQWNPSGEIRPMENRGSPTQNHLDHIHARVSAGAPAHRNAMPLGATPYEMGVRGLYSGPMGPTPVTVDGFSPTATNALASSLGLDDDLGISRGLGGIVENLAKAIGLGFTAPFMRQLTGMQQMSQNPQMGGYQGLGQFTQSISPKWNADWNAIAEAESGGNWGINTGNGYSGGLQLSPSSWTAAGGDAFAPSAHLATPFQQALTAERLLQLQGPSAWPNTFVPGSSGPVGSFPTLGSPTPIGGVLGGPTTTASPAMPAYAPQQPAWQPNSGGFSGVGGLPMAAASSAISAAGMAGDAAGGMGGGTAAAAAAQMLMQLANRTIGYAGQMAGIGINGLLETFSMQDTAIGDPQSSWIGRVLAGFAGARPASQNVAGQTDAPLKQQDDLVEALNGARDAFSQTKGGLNIEQFVQAPNRNGAQAAADIAFRMATQGQR